MASASVQFDIITVNEGIPDPVHTDLLAVEEPLEIRLGYQTPERWTTRGISVTMRTPGHDFELAAGFLLSEGIVRRRQDISAMLAPESAKGNVVRVDLAPDVVFDPVRLERHFYTTSSCGVCGKASLEALSGQGLDNIPRDTPPVSMRIIHRLPDILRASQTTFDVTGGLHAAALFSSAADLIVLREDVGRHNAVDKVVGSMLLENRLPLQDGVLLVSGRASFELVQKTIAAGIPILAAVGAPSSLAVELARDFDLTLIGFVRDNRCNIYSGDWRILYET